MTYLGYDDVTAVAYIDLDDEQPSKAWRLSPRQEHRTWGACWTTGTADGLRMMWYPLVKLVRLQMSGPKWVGHHGANHPLQRLRGLSDLRPALLRKAVAAALQVKLEAVPEMETWAAHSVGLGIDVQTTNAIAAVKAGARVRCHGQRVEPGDHQGFQLDENRDVQQNGRTTKWGLMLSAYDKSAQLLHAQRKGKAPQDILVTPGIVRVEVNYEPWQLRLALGERTLGYLVRPEVGAHLFARQVARLVLPTESNATETAAQFAARSLDVILQAQTDCELGIRRVGRTQTLTPQKVQRLALVALHRDTPAEKVCALLGVSPAELCRLRQDVHDLGIDGTAETEPFSREIAPHLQPWTTAPEVPAPQPGETVGQSLSSRMRADVSKVNTLRSA